MDRSMLHECLTNCIPSVPTGRSIYLEQLHNSSITMHVTYIITAASITLFIMLCGSLAISEVTNHTIFHAQKTIDLNDPSDVYKAIIPSDVSVR